MSLWLNAIATTKDVIRMQYEKMLLILTLFQSLEIKMQTAKEITKYNPSLFPSLGIKYLESGNVKVIIRNTYSKSGTMIKKI